MLRLKSNKTGNEKNKRYSDTLNLPRTAFPLSMKQGIISKREINIQEAAEFDQLYAWQMGDSRSRTFCLHDGPPYANGEVHVGHALNKIAKDITSRVKLLQGYKVHYKPGWDCHGMPIEQKALAAIKSEHSELSPMQIRHTAEKFAGKTIERQKAAFKRWGVMADWNNECYFTFDKEYEAKQLDLFYDLYEKGLIKEDYMPVHWSPSSKTALAEAELEYNENHVSKSVYVRFLIDNIKENIQCENLNIYALIWTTTPWTLPSNKAICFGSNIKYCLVRDNKEDVLYIVAESCLEKMQTIFNNRLEIKDSFPGSVLNGATYKHPLFKDINFPMLPSNHVSVTKGTGLVHTAPAHGLDDFHLAVPHHLSVECFVDELGRYTEQVGEELNGKHVLKEGNSAVIDLMRSDILAEEDYIHSYPYDWRTKEPTIYRASRQWFINIENIKSKAL
ncbi:DgyrCDS7608 [Dimorphilus gyrociliatus]|nr:DgyrCDS7608 [Dimorphilus gyrociliatus]